MKKLLALVLALVMTMSLVTISNAAFKDADKIDYDEAVTVMNAVGVLVGDENQNFNAKENLTRAQAAKIISYLLLGNKTAEALAGSGKFTDVAKNSWSAGFVDYCASTGVVNGVGDGKFDPNGQLTGYQFAKMLLVALGYDAKIEGFTGADWQINVSKRADQADLFDNLDISGNAALTREQAAQMCLNTLKSPLVEYSNKGGSLTVNGATVNIGASNAEYKTSSTKLAEQTIYANELNSSSGKYIVEFAEQYYPKLVLDTDFDDFGRPCYTWSYDKKDLGTFAKTELLEKTFVGEVTGKDLYDVLGKSVVEDYDVTVNIDGVKDEAVNSNVFNKTAINKNNKKAVGGTGTGVVTEVYVNNDAKEVYIVIVNEYLAIAAKDYDSKKETVDFTVYGVDLKAKEYVKTNSDNKDTGARVNDYETVKGVSSDDFALVADAKEDDAYVVTLAAGVVQSVVKADVVEDVTLTSFKQGDNVKADGTTYKYSSAAEYDVDVLDNYTGISTHGKNLKDITYNIYLDTHGNLLGIDKVTVDDNYVFIAGLDTSTSNLAATNYDASAIFTDGTFQTIKVKGDKGTLVTTTGVGAYVTGDETDAIINKWCTYTVDKNGVYTLDVVADSISGNKVAQFAYEDITTAADKKNDLDIDKKNIALPADNADGAAYGNDNTVYLVAKVKQINNGEQTVIISGVDSVTTGIKNASLKAWGSDSANTTTGKTVYRGASNVSYGTYTLYKENRYIIASVVVGEDSAASNNLVYVNSSSVSMEAYDKTTDEWTWTREVIINGEKAELTEVGDRLTYLGNMDNNHWYQVKYNAKGQVVDVLDWGGDADYTNWDLTTDGKYITDINGLKAAIKAHDTVLFEDSYPVAGSNTVATMKGSTLYVDKDLTQGFYVDENAKVVFIQTNDGKTTTEYETGSDEVQSFIESLNVDKATGKYNYVISAILQNGAAQVVIIEDKADSTVNKGQEVADKKTQVNDLTVSTSGGIEISLYVKDGSAAVRLTDEEIADLLIANGYTDVTLDATNGWSCKKGNLSYTGLSVHQNQVYKVTVTSIAGKSYTFNGASALTLYMKASDSATIDLSDSSASGWAGWKAELGASSVTGIGVTSAPSADDTKVAFTLTTSSLAADANVTIKVSM